MTGPILSTPTMVDVAKAAGVGVATVDRVLSGRAKVRQQTREKVFEAAKVLGYTRLVEASNDNAVSASRAATRRLGFVLLKRTTPFYRLIAEALIDASKGYQEVQVTPVVEYLDALTPEHVAEAMLRLGQTVDAIGVVSTDHPAVSQAISQLHERNVPVFALISDLTANGLCAGYIGTECRKQGRTAAWALSRMASPGAVGIVTGSHRYVCQELYEIAFRSFFREKAPAFRVVEPIFSQEEPAIAAAAVRQLLEEQPDLTGLYIAGGGVEGVLEMDELSRPSLCTVCHELTSTTRAALVEGKVDMVLSLPRREFAERAVRTMIERLSRIDADGPSLAVLPFDIFTPENI